MSVVDKFDRLADGFSEREFADPQRYFARRADAALQLGPRLAPGARVLDLGCGDGTAAVPFLARGFAYRGVDLSPGMVEVARARLGDRARFDVGDMERYAPPEPVALTTCFRAVIYPGDLRAFFERVASYTEGKLVFDYSLRACDEGELYAALRAAGFDRIARRPFLVPQHYAPPAAADALLRLAERAGPLVRPVLRRRFTYVCSAWRA